MNKIDIIIPVKNEEKNVLPLAQRIHAALKKLKIDYSMIFVDDRSTDKTVQTIESLYDEYPVRLHKKQGSGGKAYSIVEAVQISNAPFIAMIDGDLQYPPESIPEMLKKLETEGVGVVVANRKKEKIGRLRRIVSKANALLLGKLLLNFNCDAQSGLKLFKREIFEHLDLKDIKPWSFDMPLLYTAQELGLKIETVEIDFSERQNGKSKVSLFKTTTQIATTALKLKLKRKKIYHIKPQKPNSMLGAGVSFKRKRFITHTTLHHDKSALVTFKRWQKIFILLILSILAFGLVKSPLLTAKIFIGVLSFVYFVDVLFNFFLILKSLHFPPELSFSDEELAQIKDQSLPIYSILCPLYREAHVLPNFLQSINNLDYPKEKLDVLLLLEEDDGETIDAAKKMKLPDYVRILIVPHSYPKTKPKACNYGLSHAIGEYVVIYDAEDAPESSQLKKAYLGFQKVKSSVFCLQAKLNYYNPNHNLLTRLFTAEYSLWFDVILPGLQSIEATIPLGGTSNHFRTADLLKLEGWDPFNVTEDCDLGVRLFKAGYKTAIIDSTTLEEANSNLKNWIRQRSRWIKGYIQSYLVHMRNPLEFIKNHGIQALIFQLIVGGKIAFMLINPILWLATFSYFALYKFVGPTIEALYPPVIFYMAATSLVVGNFMFLYYYMIGCAKKEHWTVIKFVFLVPIYWLMVSYAALVALIQLITKPHYWEKTNHGLHLKKQEIKEKEQLIVDINNQIPVKSEKLSKSLIGGIALIVASMIANVLNLLFNIYLGKSIGLESFGLISLFGGIIALIQIPLSSYSRTITHKTAYLLGKYSTPVKTYWKELRNASYLPSFLFALAWIAITPFLARYFQSSPLPFFLLTPLWLIGIPSSIDSGITNGNLKFVSVAITTIVEVVAKFASTIFLVTFGFKDFVYLSFSFSAVISFLVGWILVLFINRKGIEIKKENLPVFPKKFYISTFFTKISTIAFLSVDVIIAKHFLNPREAGEYALLSLAGKLVFYLGTLFTQFVNPLVSKNEGLGKSSRKTFGFILGLTTASVSFGFLLFGVFGKFTVPLIFGVAKTQSIITFLPLYNYAMACICIASAIVSYHQSKDKHAFAYLSLFFSILLVLGLFVWHSAIRDFSFVLSVVGITYLCAVFLLHEFSSKVKVQKSTKKLLKILILNWRDTKHKWAGGAEVYVHELAQNWVKEGHLVTLFCGNDQKCPRNEVVDGVQVVRRGGFYTVYIWAFIYYLFAFRRKYDVIVESVNGVPFFTPFYSRIKKIIISYHVHQNVFRSHLRFPLSTLASVMEKNLMPLVYRNTQFVTISASSKNDLLNANLTKNENISIVNPGITSKLYKKVPKTKYPSFSYVGRLQHYKNIDIALKAFAKVVKIHKDAEFAIVGEGEQGQYLKNITHNLGLSENVFFLGKVSEEEKARVFGRTWASIQPSSFEGWGITVIEANAAGTPVIASKVNGLKDSVVDGITGLLVPEKDIKALAYAMNSIIEDKSLRNYLSKEALKWSKQFSWEKTSKQFLKIINENYSDDTTKIEGDFQYV
ncbi:glycosyltransferase [Candidatus Woesebacteria bacterium]|nr:glycosyltransferase [Candidatus Woesebacteria bacterium]QQG47187.1 MAG: glycosyltransferase [Candidatus Woesebacteria bacterium]